VSVARSSSAFLIVVSGPSGVGKTTLVDRVLATDALVRRSISATTRAPRAGEVEGRDYFFVTANRFEAMKAGELIEWADVHGAFYGTPRRFLEGELAAGRDVILNIDIQGGDKVKRSFPGAVMVFILPPSFGALEARLRARGDLTPDVLKVRLANARTEITAAARYDYVVLNDSVERAAGELVAIVTAERCRRERMNPGFISEISR
jgi:guanylate kinase